MFNSLSSLNGLIEEQPTWLKHLLLNFQGIPVCLDPTPNGLEKFPEVRLPVNTFPVKNTFGEALASLEIDIDPQYLRTFRL
ncbi:hypothetical protein CS542_02495 [Pedobacter sp. IW39]|nr:hypothetical protein CS542_02495 [Pedobacter sp. IW39]